VTSTNQQLKLLAIEGEEYFVVDV